MLLEICSWAFELESIPQSLRRLCWRKARILVMLRDQGASRAIRVYHLRLWKGARHRRMFSVLGIPFRDLGNNSKLKMAASFRGSMCTVCLVAMKTDMSNAQNERRGCKKAQTTVQTLIFSAGDDVIILKRACHSLVYFWINLKCIKAFLVK